MTATLHFRWGEAFTGTPMSDERGRAFTMVPRACTRCGGAGGSDKWKHTGWTCFDCGGSGKHKDGPKSHRLFTAEELAKLNAAAEKRAAKKAAKLAAEAAAAKAEADARREGFEAEHGELIARAEAFAERSPFIKDVARKAREKASLTIAQKEGLEAAIAKIEASDRAKAASRHVGKIGERLTLTVVTERIFSMETQFGAMHIVSMRDSNGNAIVAKGKFLPWGAEWTEEHGWKIDREPFTIKATVKEHGRFRDELQTIVNRVAEVEAPAAA